MDSLFIDSQSKASCKLASTEWQKVKLKILLNMKATILFSVILNVITYNLVCIFPVLHEKHPLTHIRCPHYYFLSEADSLCNLHEDS